MVLGLDIGSCYTKGALFDGVMIRKTVVRTALQPQRAIEQVLGELTDYTGIATNIFRGFNRRFNRNIH